MLCETSYIEAVEDWSTISQSRAFSTEPTEALKTWAAEIYPHNRISIQIDMLICQPRWEFQAIISILEKYICDVLAQDVMTTIPHVSCAGARA